VKFTQVPDLAKIGGIKNPSIYSILKTPNKMTTEQFQKMQLEYKNKVTYLHNNIREGKSYLINGKPHKYIGFQTNKLHEKAHVFLREGRTAPLILGREELSILDIFETIKIK
jgi:hypothetical protein